MRIVRNFPFKSTLREISPCKGTWRSMAVSIPNKHDNEERGGADHVENGKVGETLVAFNKPRLPPVLGPLVVLSFLENLSSDGDE